MNPIEFRGNFREFLKEDKRYKKFVATINRGKNARLLFWQERALEQFSEKYDLHTPSYEELREIFNLCELHGNPLEHGKVKVFCGHIDYSPKYNKACVELFPNSYMSEVNGPEEMYGKHYNIRFCQACREVEEQWRNKNG